MAITGAIFDCDGTLVDSMQMWHDVEVELLRRNGVPDEERVFEETEHVSADEMCDLFHTYYGATKTGPELFAELMEMVCDAYRNTVPIYDGCAELLRELHAAGVRLAVASATTADEVRVALRAQGIEDLFDYVVSTADVGKGKEDPDVYLRVCELLGTDLESTWVFEDAPFGLRTARRAGFHTVCIFNGHDGRDEDVCRAYSDLFSHEYVELSLAAINDYVRPAQRREGVLRALVVDGSPEPSSRELVAGLADVADYVIAVDRGAQALLDAGVAPDVFCGDADSVGSEALAWARRTSHVDIEFPADKYATDLALALDCARHEADRRAASLELTVTCATGGRLDHCLAVMGQLVRAADAGVRLVEDGFECRILDARAGRCIGREGGNGSADVARDQSWDIRGAQGATFSFVPLDAGAEVTLEGFKWELAHHRSDMLDDLGISNVVVADAATVTCHDGVIAAFLLG